MAAGAASDVAPASALLSVWAVLDAAAAMVAAAATEAPPLAPGRTAPAARVGAAEHAVAAAVAAHEARPARPDVRRGRPKAA